MLILTQFILRLSFGMALGMALTSPRQVTSGYYRNHLYVLLGLNVLATMAAFATPDRFPLAPPLAAAVLCYLGSVVWLYEKPRAGIVMLAMISAVSLWGARANTDWSRATDPASWFLLALDAPSAGLVLGFTMAAMFLGHWYLNTPTMAIGPLNKLVLLMAAAIVLRALVEEATLAVDWNTSEPIAKPAVLVWLRWLSGIVGALGLTWMTWRTLKIPNTQSATGILYVAVIVTFLSELTAILLATQTA